MASASEVRPASWASPSASGASRRTISRDLALPDDHGVEARRHPEQVAEGGLAEEEVPGRRHREALVDRDPQHAARDVRLGVKQHLHAVAGAEQDDAGDAVDLVQALRETRNVVTDALDLG